MSANNWKEGDLLVEPVTITICMILRNAEIRDRRNILTEKSREWYRREHEREYHVEDAQK